MLFKTKCMSAVMLASLALGGCGSSSSLDEAVQSDVSDGLTGSLELAITDAEEDFLTYRIELESMKLKKKNGAMIEVLPLETDIDFVQYQELSELFAVLSVPAGEYDSVVLALDYSNADIVIQDEEGVSYQASVQDSDGNPVGKLDVELNLNDGNDIRITPFKRSRLTLDLDLAASNTIESFVPAVVSVEPFMLGNTSLDETREHRVRGLLKGVDLEAENITVDLRPMRLREGEFGGFTFGVDEQTVFEINGAEYDVSEGLALLSELGDATPVVAFGLPKRIGERYLASQVIAGSSVPWADDDVLIGVITARNGNTLTLNGAVLEQGDGSAQFANGVNVLVSDETQVTGYRLGDADISSLSVGQRLIALGEFDETGAEFDATQGHIRMKLNALVGEVAQVSPLKLDLSHINKRPIDVFDFAGTGVDAANDANPNAYEIETGVLDLSSLALDEWVQVRGYPSSFGDAPMDFEALSLIDPDLASHHARMFARWSGINEDSVSVESAGLSLDLDEASSKLHLVGLPGSSTLNLQAELIQSEDDKGRFAILIRDGGIHMFASFDNYLVAVNDYLQDGYEVKHLITSGLYELESGELPASLDANYVTMHMVHPE